MATIHDALRQAMAHHNAGQFVEAAQLYRAILQADPNQRDAIYLSGVLAYQTGDAIAAIEMIERAVALGMNTAELFNNLGAAFLGIRQEARAIECFERAIALNPEFSQAHYNRANTFKERKQYDVAIPGFREAIRLRPDYAPALNNLASVLIDQGDMQEARGLLERAVAADPGYLRAYTNLGLICQKTGHAVQAEDYYNRALQIKPDHALAHNNLASLYFENSRGDQALQHYRLAMQYDPSMFDAQAGIGAVLAAQGKHEEAREAYRQAQALRDDPGLQVRLALLTYVIPRDEEEVESTRQRVERELDRLLQADVTIADPHQQIGTTQFYLAYQGRDDRPLQERIAGVMRHVSPSLEYTAEHCRGGNRPTIDGRPIRVGFLSKYFHDHPVGKHFAGTIQNLSREQFEVLVLRPPAPLDPVARAIGDASQGLITLHHQINIAREQIAKAKLDVLIHADIGMDPWSGYLAYARLAPVQCVLSGHPVTTGLSTIDYFISSRHMEPDGAQEHYTERLVQLDHLPNYYQRPQLPSTLKSRSELGLPDTGRLYVTAQTLFKYQPAEDVWLADILRGDPTGWLIFFQGRYAHWTTLIRERLAKNAPDVAERIVFIPRKAAADYLQVLKHADAVLDTPRFNGGTTSLDALGIGAPIVTLSGPFLRSRVTSGFYRQLGVLDLVANNGQEYVQLALRLGSDPAWRASIRDRILAASDVLFENPQAVRGLEQFLLGAARPESQRSS